RSLATPAPTVPRPSRPMRTSFTVEGTARAPARSGLELLEAAQRLPDPLLVLDQREAHVPFAVLAEADAGRDGDLGLLHAELGELQRAEPAERLGDGRPHEHRPLGLVDRPSDLVQTVHEHVATLAVHL